MPLVPQELPTHVGDMATLGASLLTDIQSAPTTEQLSALLTPYVDAHSPMMLQVFANQAVECPDFAD